MTVFEKGKANNKKVLRASEAFGEVALLYESARTATVTALTDVKIWQLDGNIFKRIIIESN